MIVWIGEGGSSMRKLVIALAALVVVAGAAWYITRADNAETVALDHLRASMRDPDSTTFQNVSVYRFRGPDDIQMAFVCGDVNSKNADRKSTRLNSSH